MRTNKIGKIAEKLLDMWATQANCTVNKAIEDEKGWDFIIEFPPDFSPDGKPLPLDLVDTPLKCWVQVKATDNRNRKCQVNLKNWLSLIKTPYPAFFLTFEFDGRDYPQRAFLVHIDKKYIERVLKRLRELGSENQNRLHKKRMQFTYGQIDELNSFDGKGLVNSIRKYVRSTNEYIEMKRKLLNDLGYEQGQYLVKFSYTLPSAQGTDPLNHFVDFSLGIVPHIETTHIEIKEVRFGLEAPELTKVLYEPQIITFRNKPVESGNVIFRLEDYSREINIKVNVYFPVGFSFELDEKYRKIRFAAPFFEMILGSMGQVEYRFVFPRMEKIYKLYDLYQISRLLLLFNEARTKKISVLVEIEFGDIHVRSKRRISEHIIDQETSNIFTKVEQAWEIANYFDIEDVIEISLVEILNEELFDLIYHLIKPKKLISYKYVLSVDSGHKSKLTYYPKFFMFPFGQYAILLTIVLIGVAKQNNLINDVQMEWSVNVNEIQFFNKLCLLRSNDLEIYEYAEEMYNAAVAQFDDSGQQILMDDIQKLLRDL